MTRRVTAAYNILAIAALVYFGFAFLSGVDEMGPPVERSKCVTEQQLVEYFRNYPGADMIGKIRGRRTVARFLKRFVKATGVKDETRVDRLIIFTHPTEPMYGVFEFIGNCYENKYLLIDPKLYDEILEKLGLYTA